MKTVERMASNRADKASVIYPAEIGRAEWVLDNPPSAIGLKLLLLAVSALGEAVSDDVLHKLPVPLLRQVPGVAGMSKDDLVGVLRSLVVASATLDLPDVKRPGRGTVAVGALVSYAEIDYNEASILEVRLRFGDVFRKMLAASELFAIINRALALSMKSRYSVLLYQFIATHWQKKHVQQIKLPLADLRRVFALSPDTHGEFKAFRRHVLTRAVSEISKVSPYKLAAQPYFEGTRAVAGIVLSWEAKGAEMPAGSASAASSSGGGKPAARGRKPSASASAPRVSSGAEKLAFYAGMVKRKAPGVSGAVSSTMAQRLLAAGLVSQADLRAANLPTD
ncbi:plasmid replication protein RepB-d (plasmid) [Paracoccus marcusii]|uniref:replication initiation protein n=1 Tax=Paracoccus marcusii TaxID=59779 RepID=UPI001C3E1BC8|nr:replication initiation protein [Paracoccus marcusii]QXI66188.1 plasmid replication protein RepB-d [Paracoccus marcusii]